MEFIESAIDAKINEYKSYMYGIPKRYGSRDDIATAIESIYAAMGVRTRLEIFIFASYPAMQEFIIHARTIGVNRRGIYMESDDLKSTLYKYLRKMFAINTRERMTRAVRIHDAIKISRQFAPHERDFNQFAHMFSTSKQIPLGICTDVANMLTISYYETQSDIEASYHTLSIRDKQMWEAMQWYASLPAYAIWAIQTYLAACFVCNIPVKVSKDTQGRFHSKEEPAILWTDGRGYYYIHGVRFDEALWRQVVKDKISLRQLINIKNIEQRYAATTLYGVDRLIEESGAQLIDESERGNKLYRITALQRNNTMRLLVYKDPSTDRKYCSFVPLSTNNADEAMAWKLHLLKKEYAQLKVEA